MISLYVTLIVLSTYLAIGWFFKVKGPSTLTVAPVIPSTDPFGIGAIIDAAQHIRTNSFFEWIRKALNVPGHTAELQVLGTRIIITDNPKNVQAILSSNFSSFGKGQTAHKVWQDLMLDSVFSSMIYPINSASHLNRTRADCISLLSADGIVWQANKNHLREHTTRVRESDYDITEKHLKNFIQMVSDGQAHDCLDLTDRLSLDTVSEVFFGQSLETLLTEEQPIRNAVEKMYKNNTLRHLLGNIGPWLPGNTAASRVLQAYLDSIIDRASNFESEPDSAEKGRREKTLLGVLVAQNIPRKVIKDQLMAILLGGKDPAAISITWALYALARNPHMVVKLRQEIESVCEFSALPQAAHFKQLPYLHNVVQETLRVYHPLGFNARTALDDTFLPIGGGPDGKSRIDVPKGTHTILSVATLQRRHDLIGLDADVFNPDRWQDWKPQTWEFIPFNRGPRICLGRNFAYMQMEYVLCRLFQVFRAVKLEQDDVSDTADAGMKIKVALNTKPANPVMIRFYK